MESNVIFTTGYGPNYTAATVCVPTIVEYCERHNYTLRIDKYKEHGPAAHSRKIDTILDSLTDTNTVIWIDADCMIKNMDYDISPLLNHDLAFSMDHKGICSGFIITKKYAADLFKCVKLIGKLKPEWIQMYTGNIDQPIIKLLIEAGTKWKYYPYQNQSCQTLCLAPKILTLLGYSIYGHMIDLNG